jgi:hypothetical protein
MWDYIKSRLSEGSTWKGILTLAVGAGLKLTNLQVDTIATTMVSVYAGLSVLFPNFFGKKP